MENSRAVLKSYSLANDLGPLGDYPAKFRQYISDQHYSKQTIRAYGRCVDILAAAMKVRRLTIQDIDEPRAITLVGESGRRPFTHTWRSFIMKRFVRFLNDQGVGKPPAPPTAAEMAWAELRRDYETYLRCQRGFSDKTIVESWRFADRFVKFRFGQEIGDLSQIKSPEIASFLHQWTQRREPYRDTSVASHLRNFFRYLFEAGKTPVNLSLGIPCVAKCYGTRLPRHLTPEQVEMVIKAVSSDEKPESRRNYAMVLLLARLGLRAQEVAAMQLDDIDWRSGELIVRGKGDRHDRVPLPPDVGEALADYIRLDRVTSSRMLFVSPRPPHEPLKNGQVLNVILKDAFARTGLKPPAPYVGSHILRHSLATHLVQRGASLEEIGDMLRHRRAARPCFMPGWTSMVCDRSLTRGRWPEV